MDTGLYRYKAKVTKVYDGDTCTVDIDLGMGTWIRGEKLRLYRINAPEVRGVERPQGLISRDFLRGQIKGKEVIIQTVKDKKGKYGRYLADIWLKGDDEKWININDLLVSQGYAEYKDY
jgi:micrococcal nuclease